MMCWHKWKWAAIEVRQVSVQYIWSGVEVGKPGNETQRWQRATCQKCNKQKENRVS